MTNTQTILVFVYGSLRRGEEFHGPLIGAESLGAHLTAPVYEMWDLDGYPAITPGGSTTIHGELYRVDAQTLAALDELEEVPTLYQREEIPTDHGPAHVYIVREPPCARVQVPSGLWPRQA